MKAEVVIVIVAEEKEDDDDDNMFEEILSYKIKTVSKNEKLYQLLEWTEGDHFTFICSNLIVFHRLKMKKNLQNKKKLLICILLLIVQ